MANRGGLRAVCLGAARPLLPDARRLLLRGKDRATGRARSSFSGRVEKPKTKPSAAQARAWPAQRPPQLTCRKASRTPAPDGLLKRTPTAQAKGEAAGQPDAAPGPGVGRSRGSGRGWLNRQTRPGRGLRRLQQRRNGRSAVCAAFGRFGRFERANQPC